MEAAKNSVLTYRRTLVSPRSPVSSDLWNDNVSEIGADLRTLATQVNRILWAINMGANKEVIWSNSITGVEGEHGIDAKALWWDSSASSKVSIYDHVNVLSSQITAINEVTIPSLEADDIGYANANVNWFVDSVNQNVKHALDKIIQELPTITGPDGLPGVLLSNVTIDESLTQEASGDGYTVGTNDIPWDGGYFTNLNVTGTLVIGGTVINASGLTTTAAGVTYTPGAGTPNYDGETITNVQEALDVVGAFDMDQLFPKAHLPIKQIPTVGMTGTAGATVKEWLNEMFFPFLNPIIVFNNPLRELGGTSPVVLDGTIEVRDEAQLNSMTLTDTTNTVGYTPTISAISNGFATWTQTVNITDNASFDLSLSAGSSAYNVSGPTTAVQFFAPTFYAIGDENLTEVNMKAAGTTQKTVQSSKAGSHAFTLTNSYIYIFSPVVHGELTSIKDQNGFENIEAVDFLNAFGGSLQSGAIAVSLQLADGTPHDYYIYRWKDSTTQSNFTLTFS